jgi:hypothetical protein
MRRMNGLLLGIAALTAVSTTADAADSCGLEAPTISVGRDGITPPM